MLKLYDPGGLPQDKVLQEWDDRVVRAIWSFRRLVLFPERRHFSDSVRLGLVGKFAVPDCLSRTKPGANRPSLSDRTFFA